MSAAMQWLFTTPRRLYGTLSAALVLALVLTVGLVVVRVAGGPPAPRSAATEATPAPFPDDNVTVVPDTVQLEEPGNAEDAALEAVRGKGHGEPVRAVVSARDGLVQVVDVRTSTGEVGEVVLLVDGPSFVVDGVTWSRP